MFFAREAVQVSGDYRSFTHAADAGQSVTFHFCPACGSSLFWEPSRKPEALAVGLGSFADDDFPMPDQSVWDEERYAWVTLDPRIVRRPRG